MALSLQATAAERTPVARKRPKRRPAWQQQLRARVPGVVSFAAFILIWQSAIWVFDPKPVLLPGPGAVWEAFLGAISDGTLWPAVTDSMSAMMIGLVLALVVGIPLGLLIGMSPTTDLLTSPYLWGFFAMPRIALAPLLILWLGFGAETKVILVFLSAVIPLMLSCKDGVQTADQSLIDAARSFGANRSTSSTRSCPGHAALHRQRDPQRHLPRLRRAPGDRAHRRVGGHRHPGDELDAQLRHRPDVRVRGGAHRLCDGADRARADGWRSYASRWREEVTV